MSAFSWAFNWILQIPPEEPDVPHPEPPIPPPTSDCVTLAQLRAELAALKNDILSVVATNSALASAKNEILAAVGPTDCATFADLTAAKTEILDAIDAIDTGTPNPSAGYAMVNGVRYNKLLDAANAVQLNGVVEIWGVMEDLNATAGFPLSCTIQGMTADAGLLWTLGTAERMALGKGLIVCSGAGQSYLIDGLTLSGARVVDRNGAGVRGDGAALITIRDCVIHNNENGVLSIASRLEMYGNTFFNNGNSSGSAHGVYVNSTAVQEVIAEDNDFGYANVGNQFKSRAKRTVLRRNTIAELAGAGSWQIDLSNGGDVVIEKNVIEQGPNAQNRNIVSYGPEGIPADGRTNFLVYTDNVMINDHAQDAWGINLFNQPAGLIFTDNTYVGLFADHVVNGSVGATDWVFADRAAAGYAVYPSLPEVPV